MGVIFEILKLPERKREKFVERIIHQEAAEKLKPRKKNKFKIKLSK